MANVTKAVIRMYKMGTGDCFVIKFFKGTRQSFTMMIDCGVWSGANEKLKPYMEEIAGYIDNHIDLLVVTHEHQDHVRVFESCKEIWEKISVDKVWMAWTENESSKKTKQWQKEYGNKKKALAMAGQKLKEAISSTAYVNQMNTEFNGIQRIAAQQSFCEVLGDFNILQNNMLDDGTYVGPLPGMDRVKTKIGKGKTEYFGPGDIIDGIKGLEGITFYVLGPPQSWDNVKAETGGKGESYDHNKELAEGEAFATAILAADDEMLASAARPFDVSYTDGKLGSNELIYNAPEDGWRKIDYDWLNSAGSFALRINSITNNLSLALAIEFKESGRVMLFPGDAEYGSWASWHTIKWAAPSRNKGKHLTEDLLNRTVFYKVAHHSSHHGTAEKLGMEMMTDDGLAAMITLDYKVISKNWKNTMPNRPLLQALLKQTKGRLMVMNTDEVYYDKENTVQLKTAILQERNKMNAKEWKLFNAYHDDNPNNRHIEYTVMG